MHVAENPKISDQSFPKREEGCTCPLDIFSGCFVGKEVPTVYSRKTHSRKTPITFGNQVKNVASVCTKGLVDEIDIISKLRMSSFALAERASECEVWLQQRGDC